MVQWGGGAVLSRGKRAPPGLSTKKTRRFRGALLRKNGQQLCCALEPESPISSSLRLPALFQQRERLQSRERQRPPQTSELSQPWLFRRSSSWPICGHPSTSCSQD